MSFWRRLLSPSMAWVLAIVPPAMTFIYCAMYRDYQVDLWHHLARGRAMAQQGEIVNRDLFTFTVPQIEFQDVNWLTQLVYYSLFSLGGLDLVQTVNGLAWAAIVALLVHLCYRASGSMLTASALGLFGFFALLQMMTIRPQTFSLLLFLLLYEILEASERRPWLLLLPPLVEALWVNVHGAFPIGIVLIGVFLLDAAWDGWRNRHAAPWRDRRTLCLAACLAAAAAAMLANPYRWNVFQYVGITTARATSRDVMEWKAIPLTALIGKMWVASLLLLLVSFLLPGRRPRARDLILVFVFLPPAYGAARMMGWWFLICLPIVAAQIGAALPVAWREDPDFLRSSSLLARVTFFGVLLVSVCSVPGVGGRLFPRTAFANPHQFNEELDKVSNRFLDVHGPGGRLFSIYQLGEYLQWNLAPYDCKVFLDCRIEIFPDNVFEEYLGVINGRADWHEILDRYQVDGLVLVKRQPHDVKPQNDLKPLVDRSGQWELAEETGSFLLYVRTAAAKKPSRDRQGAGQVPAS